MAWPSQIETKGTKTFKGAWSDAVVSPWEVHDCACLEAVPSGVSDFMLLIHFPYITKQGGFLSAPPPLDIIEKIK
jgi:hypothetical protein